MPFMILNYKLIYLFRNVAFLLICYNSSAIFLNVFQDRPNHLLIINIFFMYGNNISKSLRRNSFNMNLKKKNYDPTACILLKVEQS